VRSCVSPRCVKIILLSKAGYGRVRRENYVTIEEITGFAQPSLALCKSTFIARLIQLTGMLFCHSHSDKNNHSNPLLMNGYVPTSNRVSYISTLYITKIPLLWVPTHFQKIFSALFQHLFNTKLKDLNDII